MRRPPDGSPTLLVLYPYLEGFPARRIAGVCAEHAGLTGAARRGPLRLLLADESPQQLEHEGFDELLELPAPERVAESLELLRGYCDRCVPAGVFLQSEVALPVGALLARELGLPAPSVEAVHACTNKYLCRCLLARAGVPVPAFRLAESAAGARRFAREHGYPLVLKAVASSMSRLVTLVAHEGQLEEAVAVLRRRLPESGDLQRLDGLVRAAGLDPGCDPLRQFLVESYAAGVSVETDGLVVAGVPYTFGVTEQIPSRNPPFFFEGYLLPAESPQVDREEARRVSDAALRAVGLSDSGFAVEMRAREGRVQVIEVNGRLGLDDGFEEMFQLHTGCHPMQAAALLALGQRRPPVLRHSGCLALAYRNCYREARVLRLPTPEELARVSTDGLLVGLAAVEGKRFHAPPHPEAYPHVAWALGRHGSSSRAAYAAARAVLARLPIELTEL
jgi:hypothetical protein